MRPFTRCLGSLAFVGTILGVCFGEALPEGAIRLTGRVVMPDGSPAADATVTSFGMNGIAVSAQIQTDAEGRFEFTDVFTFGCLWHVSSKDQRHQAFLQMDASLIRKSFPKPAEIILKPAREIVVIVTSEGKPADKARVVAIGSSGSYRIRGITNSDGNTSIWLPTDEKLREIHAWHPNLGVGGNQKIAEMGDVNSFTLSLLPPVSHTVRVVDMEGQSVPGVRLGITVRVDETADWIVPNYIEESHLHTNQEGVATVPWFPKGGSSHLDLQVFETNWKEHDVETSDDEETTIVRIRRRHPVVGRIIMPEGQSAGGILITGSAFGPTNLGDRAITRARSDGSFELRVASDHAYVLGILDQDWASDIWNGVILVDDSSDPAEIVLHAYPATKVNVRVTRGPERSPVANTSISSRTAKEISWQDSTGERRRGSTGPYRWLRTDSDGFAEANVGKGKLHLGLRAGEWQEEKIVEIKSDEPISVDFHRPWHGERKIAVRLTVDGSPLAASSQTLVGVMMLDQNGRPTRVEPAILSDGRIEAAVDALHLMVLAVDRDKRRSGFTFVGPDDSEIELPMIEAGTFGGTLVDEKGLPMPKRKLRLTVYSYDKVTANGKSFRLSMAGSDDLAAEEQITDDQGRFRFDAVATNVPLMLRMEKEEDGRTAFSSLERCFFFPGEQRVDERIVVETENNYNVEREVPLGERIADTVETVGPVGMHTLVLLQGDDTQNVTTLTNRIMDHDEVEAILGYLPLTVQAKDVEREVAELEKRGWERPQAGEISLVALDGRGELLGIARITTGNAKEASAKGVGFLKAHAPPVDDALEKLDHARAEARRSDRKVWIVHGGPRCGPCFGLARWMKQHHELIEKDYVVLKLKGGWDQHVDEVLATVNRPQGSIPWMAITDPDGNVLVTSDGPLGNIGFPGGYESLRHFRKMLQRTSQHLTDEEIEELVRSLENR